MSLPPDFGGLVGFWPGRELRGNAVIGQYKHGKAHQSMALSPLNVLQLRKLLDDLIAEGERRGFITEEHHRQSSLLPTASDLDKIMPRDEVDRIAGQG